MYHDDALFNFVISLTGTIVLSAKRKYAVSLSSLTTIDEFHNEDNAVQNGKFSLFILTSFLEIDIMMQ